MRGVTAGRGLAVIIIIGVACGADQRGADVAEAAGRLGHILGEQVRRELGLHEYRETGEPGSLAGVRPPTAALLADRLETKLAGAVRLLRRQLDGDGGGDGDGDPAGDGDRRPEVPHAGLVTLTPAAVEGEVLSATPVAVEHRRVYHEAVYREDRRVVVVAQGGAKIGAVLGQLLSLLSPMDRVAVLPLSGLDVSHETCYPNGSLVPPADLLAAAVARKLSLYDAIPTDEAVAAVAGEARRLISSGSGTGMVICFCDDAVHGAVGRELGEDVEAVLVRCLPGESGRNGPCADGKRTPAELASAVLLATGMSATDAAVAGAPRRATVGGPVTVPIALATPSGRVAVVDLFLAELVEDLTRPSVSLDGTSAFFVSRDSVLIGHSKFPRPDGPSPPPRVVPASDVEGADFALAVWPIALGRSSGRSVVPSGVAYSWRWAAETIAVFVKTDPESEADASSREEANGKSGDFPQDLRYHRLDLVPPQDARPCAHFGRLSTVDRGVLYLAPSAFDSPFARLRETEGSTAAVRRLMAYLKDETGLLSNPGLFEGVREEAAFLGRLLDRLETRRNRELGRYVVRRFAAASGGAMVSYPGSVFESDGEPAREMWFVESLRNKDRVNYALPRPDAGGFGRSVSVSFAAPRSPGEPVVVLGADLTVGFLRRVIREAAPVCFDSGTRCFLMDDRGYLVYHPGLSETKTAGPVERQHVTHRESLVANDMLGHRELVKKKSCVDVAGGTVQRYYEFNLSLVGSIGNTVPNDHCSKYSLAAVPGTDLFFGFVRSSCELGAFCPCSVVDRLCLNCNRMEQNECECPCECGKLPADECAASSDSSICAVSPDKDSGYKFIPELSEPIKRLPPCYDFHCESYTRESDCEGVLGCEWCRLDEDGISDLSTPFCTTQTTCYDGVLGATIPYLDGSVGRVIQEDIFAAYSAVGPVVGCVVALCLILAIAVYCYRQNSSNNSVNDVFTSPAPETWQDNNVRLNHLTVEEDPREDHNGYREKLLVTDSPSTPISPYKIVTGYRRPNTAGESDHGYSTMTPHDDSEHLAFALAEPFLSKETDDPTVRNSSPTISTPRSSATDIPFTNLPCGKNNVIASVTVHRHMEAL